MPTKSLRGALAALLIAAACVVQEPYSTSGNTLVVHAVLDVTSRDQYVIVQSTTGRLPGQTVVTGASVVITAPDGRQLVAEESKDTTKFLVAAGVPRATTVYRLSLDQYGLGLNAGGTYLLRITVPDGRVVTGATTIPNAIPTSVAPTTVTMDRLRDTVALSWARVPGATAYEIFVASSRVQGGLFADTSITLTGSSELGAGRTMFASGITHSLVVNAVDENYYDYFRRTSDHFTTNGLISHLHGAVGVFGSIVPIARRTIVVR